MNIRFGQLTLLVTLLSSLALADESELAVDPHKVLGNEKCAKCHQAEIDVWKKTPHYKTFNTLHRNPEAKQIAKRLGLSSIKRNDTCIKCHYTMQHRGSRLRAISGVSCESCHGAAKDWVEQHNDYGGPDVSREQETASHKQQRRQMAIDAGMRNPVNVYLVAQSCLGCHTAPDEELVNIGGHPSGSLEFELVAWSQGMLRHNFSRSHGKRNDISSPDRLRLMYVVGLIADLEYSLRATAKATTKAKFGITSARRADRLRKKLRAINERLDNPLLQQVVDVAFRAKLKMNNAEQLDHAADAISELAFTFADTVDGSTLTVINPLMPSSRDLK